MKVKIITNNPKTIPLAEQYGYEIQLIDGTAVDVLQYCQDMVGRGWNLAADPLAGYNFVETSYYTVFMQLEFSTRKAAQEVVRLEKAADRLRYPLKGLPLTERLNYDYSEMDCSIAEATMKGLMQNVKHLKTP